MTHRWAPHLQIIKDVCTAGVELSKPLRGAKNNLGMKNYANSSASLEPINALSIILYVLWYGLNYAKR